MPVTPSLRLAAAFFALTATALVAKDLQTEPFRANTQLVSVYATVKDKTGRLVPNLTKDDFTVYDNGKPQPLSYFGNDLLPFSIVVMLDRSASMARDYDLVRDAAITFVRQMLPNDRMRIGSFSTKISIHPETFTNDQDALIDLLRTRLEPVGSSPVWTAIDQSLTAVLPEPQRRVVLVFTDGHNDQQRGQIITHLTDVLNRVRVNGVMVYCIGFVTSVQGGYAVRGPFGMPGQSGRGTFGPPRVQPPDPALKDIAEESGGGYFELGPEEDLSGTFARVAEELHRQYWLGFTPTKLDGKSHKLEVKVRGADLKVRARQNYVAAAGS